MLSLGILGLGSAPGCDAVRDDDPAAPPHVRGNGDRLVSELDPTAALFDPDRLLDVSIDIDPADWDALRFQARSFQETLAGDCLAAPFEKIFTYAPGTVTIDGESYETVGVRKKGFLGSLSSVKPSLKLKFDEYLPDQRYDTLKRLTLHNVQQDRSFLNTCLGYHVFRTAGLAAPRCNFATVEVNGQSLGLYVHVESVKKPYLGNYFLHPDEGVLWEGTLSDFRDGWSSTFELKTDEAVAPTEISDLEAALAVPDIELESSLAGVIDLDEYYTFWATEVLVGHWDGYAGNTNNYYIYREPGGLIHFLPWGADALFRDVGPYRSVFATGALPRRLYQNIPTRDAYLARLDELLDTVWDEPALLAEIDRLEAMVEPHIAAAGHDAWAASVADTRTYVESKRDSIEAERAAGPPEWTIPLRDDFCFDQLGSFSLSFDTVWNGGLASPGTGTLTYSLGSFAEPVTAVASFSGPNQHPQRDAALVFVADLADGSQLSFFLTLPDTAISPSGIAKVDWVEATGELYFSPSGGAATQVGFIAKGGVQVSSGDVVDLAPVVGTVTANIFSLAL